MSTAGVTPGERGISAHTGLPNLEHQWQEEESPSYLAVKISTALLGGETRGLLLTLLKDLTHSLTNTRPKFQQRDSSL